MRELPDMESLIVELLCVGSQKATKERHELIELIEDYFGDHDARLVLSIALFFKRPEKFHWLRKVVKEKLKEGIP